MSIEDDASPRPLPAALETALGRFDVALAALQDAAAARRGRAGTATDRVEALPWETVDPASERDAALVRAARLAHAHAEAVGRLDRVEATIRTIAGRLARPRPGPQTGDS